MWKEFKEFAFKGNVMDMAVGVMIGGAFGKIVTSVVNDLIMPLVGLLTGGVDMTSLFWQISGDVRYATLADVQEAGVAYVAYGTFLSNVLDFFVIAICVFFFVKLLGRLKGQKAEEVPAAADTRLCEYCFGEVNVAATRCPHCTSMLMVAAKENGE